jgi:uncharacterized membrane protein
MHMKTGKAHKATLRLAVAAVFMAMTIVLSSFSIPVPGGHLYLCDIPICLAAILLDPFSAFAVGGVGSFLGDLLFYPAPMFVSLVTHGLQAVVISLVSHRLLKHKPKLASGLGVSIGVVILVTGYTLGRAYVYSTPEYAVIKLPFELLQGLIGAVLGMLLCWRCGVRKLYQRMMGE